MNTSHDSLYDPLETNLSETATELLPPPSSYWSDARTRLKTNPIAVGALVFLSLLLLMAIIGPWLTPYTYYETHLPLKNLPPSSTFWFGTDELGRDLFTRVWWGARISLFVGISASVIDLLIGVCYGALAGLLRGRLSLAQQQIGCRECARPRQSSPHSRSCQ